MYKRPDRSAARIKRHKRLRQKVSGTAARPRFCVNRSLNNIYVQIIDDEAGHTLVAASSLQKDIAAKTDGLKKTEAAKLVGKIAGERALANGITTVVFDRGGYIYTGRVAGVAAGAREAGLNF